MFHAGGIFLFIFVCDYFLTDSFQIKTLVRELNVQNAKKTHFVKKTKEKTMDGHVQNFFLRNKIKMTHNSLYSQIISINVCLFKSVSFKVDKKFSQSLED